MSLPWRSRRGRPCWVAGTLAAVTAMAACGGSASPSPQPGAAPVLTVVATNFAMNELVHDIGAPLVKVIDLAQDAPDDRTLIPSAAQVAQLHSAQLVVEVGGGWQPQVEADAGTGPRVLALGHQGTSTGSQVWLDPIAMEGAAKQLEAKLIALDPAGAKTYRNGVEDFDDNMDSVDEDYQSSLGDCEYNEIFTPDSAFASMAARYSLRLYPLPEGSTTAAIDKAAAAAATQSYHAIFSEPPLPSPQVATVATIGKAALGQLDTMDGPPIKSEPATSTYFDRLEANLTYLTGALYCQENDGP